MKPLDHLIALGFAFIVLIGTMALSFPMVAVYRYAIEPGHPTEFYMEAANWIAPWSSHIFGPLLFFGLNYQAAKQPGRNAMVFAAMTIVFYVLVDFGMLPLMSYDLLATLTLSMLVSLVAKTVAAFLGAHCGRVKAIQI
jgi:hypothetical protein